MFVHCSLKQYNNLYNEKLDILYSEKTRVVIKLGPLYRYLTVPLSTPVHVTSRGAGKNVWMRRPAGETVWMRRLIWVFPGLFPD